VFEASKYVIGFNMKCTSDFFDFLVFRVINMFLGTVVFSLILLGILSQIIISHA